MIPGRIGKIKIFLKFPLLLIKYTRLGIPSEINLALSFYHTLLVVEVILDFQLQVVGFQWSGGGSVPESVRGVCASSDFIS